jgi:hypothetical protein
MGQVFVEFSGGEPGECENLPVATNSFRPTAAFYA